MINFLLSGIIGTPLLALLVLLILPAQFRAAFKYITLLATGIQLALAVWMYTAFNGLLAGIDSPAGLQFVEQYEWIRLSLGSLGFLSIDYFVGVDGLSAPMVLLTGIVMFIGAIASWNIHKGTRGYFTLYLLLSASVAGCFVALDFFLFYLFFEFMLLPMYFLIGIWGGPGREYASIKFFIYTLLGSIFILVVMIGLYTSSLDPAATALQAGLIEQAGQFTANTRQQLQALLNEGQIASKNIVHTFNLVTMTQADNFVPGSLLHITSGARLWGYSMHIVAFFALLIGFAIKLPVVPLHTWLPDAHVEAPTAISVVLAGILLKIGGYGLMRIAFPIFPDGAVACAWLMGLMGVISILYGAMNALAMQDLKKMIAYSSVSHMGFVLLGLASLTVEGVNGAIYQMFSHGLISAMLFLVVGVLYDRTHDRQIGHYRGLAIRMPKYTSFVVVAFFASLGLPGFSGFIAELFVMLGAFSSYSANSLLPRWMAVAATGGIILAAAYYLWTLQRMYFGNFWSWGGKPWKEALTDIKPREWSMLLPLTILIILFGLFPHLLLDVIAATAENFTALVLRNAGHK